MQMVLHFLGFKEIVKKASVPATSDDEDAGASDSGETESLYPKGGRER